MVLLQYVLVKDPHHLGLPEIFTVAHMGFVLIYGATEELIEAVACRM